MQIILKYFQALEKRIAKKCAKSENFAKISGGIALADRMALRRHTHAERPHVAQAAAHLKAACTPKTKVQAAFLLYLFGIGKYRSDVQRAPGQKCLRAHALAARRLQFGDTERVFAARHHDAVRVGR